MSEKNELTNGPSSAGAPERPALCEILLADCVERLTAGESVDLEALRREHPDLAEELIEQLRLFQIVAEDSPMPVPIGTLGDYTLRRQIGRGGMGVVYDAWQNSVERQVALKVLPAGLAADGKAFLRFMREARTAAQLRHRNIVGVYGMGQEENTPYYAMEYVEGETLAKVLERIRGADPGAETPFGKRDGLVYFGRLADAFADVADGLQHAHSKGVIHRDIKPSNLILDREGVLRILDFGLARIEGQESLTVSGDFVGTPRYMSPEQAQRREIQVDHRTDIYSLGATMYELLTLRPPFLGKDHTDTLSQIIERDPVEPRRIQPRVPQDLESIVLKCLEKDVRDRYGTAEALAQDLRRFVRGDFVEARPPERWKKWRRWIVRKRRSIALAAAFVLTLSFCGLAVHFYIESKRKTEAILGATSATVADPVGLLKQIFETVGAEEAAGKLWTLLDQGGQDDSLWTIWLGLTLGDLERSPSELLEKVRSVGPHSEGSGGRARSGS